MTVATAARKGQLEGLKAMRDKLAAAMDDAEPQVVAQIAGQLRTVLAEIAALSTETKGSALDDLAKRRADRLAAADAPAPAERPAQQRRR